MNTRIFSGTANPGLAAEIGAHLGLDLGGILIKQFADGELYVQLQESIRGCDVFLVQPSCPPTNSSLMELLIMIDACKRASARNITAVHSSSVRLKELLCPYSHSSLQLFKVSPRCSEMMANSCGVVVRVSSLHHLRPISTPCARQLA